MRDLAGRRDQPFSLRDRHFFRSLDYVTTIWTAHWLCKKNRDCEMFRTAQKTRLRDPWNLPQILRDLYFFRDRSPPLGLGICVSEVFSSNRQPLPTRPQIWLHHQSRFQVEEKHQFLFDKITATKNHQIQDLLPPKRSRTLRKRGISSICPR